jgi:hypothetical protein
MEKMLRRLETFTARGTDGKTYTIEAFEHLARVDVFADPQGQWEPTGEAEYRLADGHAVEVEKDGTLRVAGTGVKLQPQAHH